MFAIVHDDSQWGVEGQDIEGPGFEGDLIPKYAAKFDTITTVSKPNCCSIIIYFDKGTPALLGYH